jgi:hypothetical protein
MSLLILQSACHVRQILVFIECHEGEANRGRDASQFNSDTLAQYDGLLFLMTSGQNGELFFLVSNSNGRFG